MAPVSARELTRPARDARVVEPDDGPVPDGPLEPGVSGNAPPEYRVGSQVSHDRHPRPTPEPSADWTSVTSRAAHDAMAAPAPAPATGHPLDLDEGGSDDSDPDDEALDPDDLESEEDDTDTEQEIAPVTGTQMLVLGPGVTPQGEMVTYAIVVENARDVARAPVRVVFDPDVLELVSAAEGSFFSKDGATTRFLARDGSAPGLLEISISRIPPARGLTGNGVLCTVTFIARSAGSSPVALAGSRLMDSAGQMLEFTRGDADLAVK